MTTYKAIDKSEVSSDVLLWSDSFRDRNAEICRRASEGETYQSIADIYNITRQRVEQIVNTYATHFPVSQRKAIIDNFLTPFLAYVGANLCVVCHKEMDACGPVCRVCRARIRLLRTVKSRLRAIVAGKKHRGYTRIAAYLIRKHNIVPAELGTI